MYIHSIRDSITLTANILGILDVNWTAINECITCTKWMSLMHHRSFIIELRTLDFITVFFLIFFFSSHSLPFKFIFTSMLWSFTLFLFFFFESSSISFYDMKNSYKVCLFIFLNCLCATIFCSFDLIFFFLFYLSHHLFVLV